MVGRPSPAALLKTGMEARPTEHLLVPKLLLGSHFLYDPHRRGH